MDWGMDRLAAINSRFFFTLIEQLDELEARHEGLSGGVAFRRRHGCLLVW